MCHRFTLGNPVDLVAKEFGVSKPFGLRMWFICFPMLPVAAVRFDTDRKQREIAHLRFGLTPSWADRISEDKKLISAWSEWVSTSPSFSSAFKFRRCLIVADGFYLWRKGDGIKQVFYIRLMDRRPFGFAGVWETWERGPYKIESCAILTTGPNDLTAPIYHRMPVIIGRDDYDLWLDPAVQDIERVQPLLRPFPSDDMVAFPVESLVSIK